MKWGLLWLVFLPVLVSCKKQKAEFDVEGNLADTALLKYNNVVILGNSITYAPAAPSKGWYCNCGMAASQVQFDYVHVLESRFKIQNPNVVISARNIAKFEVDPVNFDFDTELKDLKDTRPDLVIIKLGENVSNAGLDAFDKRYTDLINYLRAGNPNVFILSGSSVWGHNTDALMSKHAPYVLFENIDSDHSRFATGLYTDFGVANHPSDKGMRYIAALMWSKIKTFK